MGTRNLTCVKINNQYRVANYGQWDGNPEGQGITTLKFLRETMNRDIFIAKVLATSFIGEEEYATLWKELGILSVDWVTIEESNKFNAAHPQFNRDNGAGIYELIQNAPSGLKLINSLDFADSGSCEYAYVINFDENRLEVYASYYGTPDQKVFIKKANDSAYAIGLWGSFSLEHLPEEEDFLSFFRKLQQEREA